MNQVETKKRKILTGVKPTGMPHLGNYFGSMKPSIEESSQPDVEQSLLFIADYHSVVNQPRPEDLKQMILEVAATWLACGLDPKKTIFIQQSQIPETFELHWILSCFTSKGLLNRAHAYKAKRAENLEFGRDDLDHGINTGLFTYPVLMAADILLYSATHIPIGPDQVQHLEIARDIALKFNRSYGDILVPPDPLPSKGSLPGIDGEKMSKSYGNHIPLFCTEKKLRKTIMKIKTDSLPPEAPKDPAASLVFDIFKAFASEEQILELKAEYRKGIGWGTAKERLFEVINAQVSPMRAEYDRLMNDSGYIHDCLKEGRSRARELSVPLIEKIRKSIGVI